MSEFNFSAILNEVMEGKTSMYSASVSGAVFAFIDKYKDLIEESKKVRRMLVSNFIGEENPHILPAKFEKILVGQGYSITDWEPIPMTLKKEKISRGSSVKITDGELKGRTGRVISIQHERRIIPIIEVLLISRDKEGNKRRVVKEFREHELDIIEAHKWGKKQGRDYSKEKDYNSSPERIKYRTALNRENRKRGTYGSGDGKDLHHAGNGEFKQEDSSKNKGRREKSRKKGSKRSK